MSCRFDLNGTVASLEARKNIFYFKDFFASHIPTPRPRQETARKEVNALIIVGLNAALEQPGDSRHARANFVK